VLRDRETVVTDVTAKFTRDSIIQAMVGRSLSGELYGSRKGKDIKVRKRGHKVVSVDNLSMGTLVRNTSFSIYAGQITGVFGLVGAGRSETMKVVAGGLKRDVFQAPVGLVDPPHTANFCRKMRLEPVHSASLSHHIFMSLDSRLLNFGRVD